MPGPTSFVRVCAASDIPDGGMSAFNVEGMDICVAHIGEDFFAIDDWCTHANAMLNMGFVHTETCEIECPLHEGRWDLRTGAPTNEPAEDQAPIFHVKVENGDVYVGPQKS